MAGLENLATDLEADIDNLGHDATVEELPIAEWVQQVEGPSQLIRLVVCRAVHDLLRTSGRAGFGEEHQTASLMGHLASQVDWYGRLAAAEAAASSVELVLPDIRWAHQEKNQEARTGVDFGLLCNPSGENGPDTEVRLVLLQAKRAFLNRHGVERFSVSQPTGLRGLTKDAAWPALDNRMVAYCLKAALLNHRSDPGAFSPEDIVSVLNRNPAELPRYQLESLLRTQFQLAARGKVDGPWCLYAVWRRPPPEQSPPPPLAVPLGVVAQHLRIAEEWRFNRPGEVGLTPGDESCHDLIAVLASALGYGPSSFGLRLRLSEVESAIGEACRLLPRLSLVTSSSSESGGLALARAITNDFQVSSSLPPPRPLRTPALPGSGPGWKI